MKNWVECYSGIEYAQRPRRILWQEEQLEVEVVVAEARSPSGKQFVVKTRDGRVFRLEYVALSDDWLIELVATGDLP